VPAMPDMKLAHPWLAPRIMPADHEINLVVVTVLGGAESVIFVTIILPKTAESPTKTAVAAAGAAAITNTLNVRLDR